MQLCESGFRVRPGARSNPYTGQVDERAREPVSRRGGPARPALSRTAIVLAGLELAEEHGLDAVSMRRVAHRLVTSASALYVYVKNRDDLLDGMFDYTMQAAARVELPKGPWQERLASLLLTAIEASSGHGGIARVALSKTPAGPNAAQVTQRVTTLLTEAGVGAADLPAALDLLGLFTTAAALDGAAQAMSTVQRRWQIDVVLRGLAN